jgi:hypothetical protein
MPPKSPVKASTKSMTTVYKGFAPKGKGFRTEKITAQQYTRTPKDGSSKSGVIWNALQAASGMPKGPKRQKAIGMLVRAYGAEQDIEAKKREKEDKKYFARERERKIKTYNRDRKK